jgi:hypothetical protein
MSRVIQIRDVPDELHDALVEAARAQGLSLNKFAQRELADAVRRRHAIAHNQAVIRRARRRMRDLGVPSFPNEEIAAAVREGRDERP